MRLKSIGAIALAAAGLIAFTTSASAAPPTDGSDDIPDVIIGGGSDTTYQIMNRLENLYSGAPGCVLITSSKVPTRASASASTTGPRRATRRVTGTTTWWRARAALGSTAGKTPLCQDPPIAYNPTIHYGRSSSGPGAADTDRCSTGHSPATRLQC